MSAMDITTLAAVGIVTAAGLVRGTTGFGGAMLMTPVLSALLGPIPAVVTALLMETAAALVMFPDALRKSAVANFAVFDLTGSRDGATRRLFLIDRRPGRCPENDLRRGHCIQFDAPVGISI
jgi:hypothetical protein